MRHLFYPSVLYDGQLSKIYQNVNRLRGGLDSVVICGFIIRKEQ